MRLCIATYLWFWCGKQNDRPYAILAMPFNFILSSSHLCFRNTQCFMAMPVNMILVMYVTMYIVIWFQQINNLVYTCTYIFLISKTNKSELTFFLSAAAIHNITWLKITHICFIQAETFENLDVWTRISFPITVIYWSKNRLKTTIVVIERIRVKINMLP